MQSVVETGFYSLFSSNHVKKPVLCSVVSLTLISSFYLAGNMTALSQISWGQQGHQIYWNMQIHAYAEHLLLYSSKLTYDK